MEDIIIIGGGVIGCSVAQKLSKYKLNIKILERNTEVCEGTTKANSAIIHAGYDAAEGSLKSKLNISGCKMFPELSERLGFIFKQTGSLVLAFDDHDMKLIEELLKRGNRNGVEGLKIISGEEARKMEPEISEEVIGALYCSTAGVVDPFGYTYALIENAVENGVELLTETIVEVFKKEGDRIAVQTDKGDYYADIVINAAGVNSGHIQNLAGDYEFDILPTKGSYRLLDKNTKIRVNTVVFQTPNEFGKGILVTPTYYDNMMVGPTAELIENKEDISASPESLQIIDKFAKKSVPEIDLNSCIRVFTGVRAKPDTGDFMIFESKKIPGIYHIGGIESPGLASSPAIANYIESMLLKKNELEFKDEFIDRRNLPAAIAKLPKEEKSRIVKENSDYGEIICRCEQVSRGEIIDSIRRTAGARTVDGVKRRVRAGMGRCQGGYCRTRVRKILAEELGIDECEIK